MTEFTVSVNALAQLMRNANTCAGYDDGRPALKQALFIVEGQTLEIWTTDSYKMLKQVWTVDVPEDGEGDFIYDSRRMLKWLQDFCGSGDMVTVAVEKDKPLIVVSCSNGAVFHDRTFEGKYPEGMAQIMNPQDVAVHDNAAFNGEYLSVLADIQPPGEAHREPGNPWRVIEMHKNQRALLRLHAGNFDADFCIMPIRMNW